MGNMEEIFGSDIVPEATQGSEAVEELKLNEQYGNLYENKGSRLGNQGLSANVIENKPSYTQNTGILLITKGKSEIRKQKSEIRKRGHQSLISSFQFLPYGTRAVGVICETWAVQVAVIPAKAGIQSPSLRKQAVYRLNSRFRGNDRRFEMDLIPNDSTAGAGTQSTGWIPAFAGMTAAWSVRVRQMTPLSPVRAPGPRP
jgi:hypothetical protein